jgi:hypothetical protein
MANLRSWQSSTPADQPTWSYCTRRMTRSPSGSTGWSGARSTSRSAASALRAGWTWSWSGWMARTSSWSSWRSCRRCVALAARGTWPRAALARIRALSRAGVAGGRGSWGRTCPRSAWRSRGRRRSVVQRGVAEGRGGSRSPRLLLTNEYRSGRYYSYARSQPRRLHDRVLMHHYGRLRRAVDDAYRAGRSPFGRPSIRVSRRVDRAGYASVERVAS